MLFSINWKRKWICVYVIVFFLACGTTDNKLVFFSVCFINKRIFSHVWRNKWCHTDCNTIQVHRTFKRKWLIIRAAFIRVKMQPIHQVQMRILGQDIISQFITQMQIITIINPRAWLARTQYRRPLPVLRIHRQRRPQVHSCPQLLRHSAMKSCPLRYQPIDHQSITKNIILRWVQRFNEIWWKANCPRKAAYTWTQNGSSIIEFGIFRRKNEIEISNNFFFVKIRIINL